MAARGRGGAEGGQKGGGSREGWTGFKGGGGGRGGVECAEMAVEAAHRLAG